MTSSHVGCSVITYPVGQREWAMEVNSWNRGVSRTPLLSAARLLLAEGVPPDAPLTLQHRGSDTIAMRTTVGAAAELTVEEGDRPSPRFRKFKEFPGQDAI